MHPARAPAAAAPQTVSTSASLQRTIDPPLSASELQVCRGVGFTDKEMFIDAQATWQTRRRALSDAYLADYKQRIRSLLDTGLAAPRVASIFNIPVTDLGLMTMPTFAKKRPASPPPPPPSLLPPVVPAVKTSKPESMAAAATMTATPAVAPHPRPPVPPTLHAAPLLLQPSLLTQDPQHPPPLLRPPLPPPPASAVPLPSICKCLLLCTIYLIPCLQTRLLCPVHQTQHRHKTLQCLTLSCKHSYAGVYTHTPLSGTSKLLLT